MKEAEYLHLGDPVWWKGEWGAEEAVMAEVESIEKDADIMTNSGIPVPKLPWRKVRRYETVKCPTGTELEAALVNLTNGHWAYGEQIYPVKMWQKVYE
ncbi:MAG: hypothetical protein M0P59_13465 [Gallionella sp.]|jgi:hypothetical protein|nr:hypothetical protein [Gallionella sp.]